MTAKEYLLQIRHKDMLIRHTQQAIAELYADRTYYRSPSGKTDVITSPTGEGFTKQSDRLVDMTARLRKKIDKLRAERYAIIRKIDALPDTRHADLLHSVYVEYKSLTVIADEMGYSYEYIRHLHSDALKAFEKMTQNNTDKRK